ncbi:hypothetical protein LCGC14_0500660 [marine sediment metagenome]|uniref:Uncharacterized protein n=1 Tax=marine sediment metagenome TaxID=412755 RepID=A0A0F9SME4_9ZZZZ|nr:MAG: hypothetical protein Lokiarch_24860 [Candidatus Lokiarchaeum sp. GC14_75]
MSEEINHKIDLILNKFKGFSNFIELEDFRAFLLFTLTSQVPMNILAQLGGGNKEVISLPYNPYLKIYYQKINLISAGSLIVYVKSEPISQEFLLKKDDPIIKEFLSLDEISLAFRGKEKFILPKVSDCSAIESENNSKLTIKVDDMFHSLESFLAVAEPNLLFVINSVNTTEPDIIFTFNMMPEMPTAINKKVLKIDGFIDPDHKTKDITYVKREEDFSLHYLKDVKEVSHSEIFKSSFSLLIHVKSLNKP